MFTLLSRISIPEIRKHLLRNVLTLIGVLLGVAIFTAIRSANSSLQGSLRDTIDQVAGKAVLQVTAGQAGLPEEIVDQVRAISGVKAAVPIIEAVVRTDEASQGNILVLGVDMAGDRSMRDYRVEGDEDAVSDPLVFLAQPDSIIVAKDFASRNGLQEDSSIRMVTAVGTKTFTVRGIMSPQGMAKAFGGNIGVMDIYAAQFVFSRGRTFDRIDIALQDGYRIDDVASRIEARLGAGFKVEPPLRRGKQTESLMEAYTRALFMTSIIALTIGLFLIFNAFSISVTQRRSQIGILRALGVTRSQIQQLFLAEGLLLGIAGSTAGIGVGLLLGRGMMFFMAGIVEQTYGIQVHVNRLHLDPWWTAVSFVLGTAASVGGALLPARAAGRVDPALALQKGKHQVLFVGESRRRRRVGAVLLALSMLASFSPWSFGGRLNGIEVQLGIFAVLFISMALIVPAFSHALALLLRRPMGRVFGISGLLAADSLVQAPRRTSATVSALMFSLCFVLIMGTFNSSVKSSLMRWVDLAINPDLFVSASDSLVARVFQFPASMAEELKKVPGVQQVDSVRLITLDYNGRAPLLISIELEQYLRRCMVMMEQGRVEDLVPEMAGRPGVLVSNNFARIHNVGKGDRIMLDTPTGRHSFEVVGVQVDYTSDNGSILVDREVYKRLWKDDRVDTFDLMLEKGRDPEEVKREIQRRFAGSHNLFVLTNRDMRSELLRITDQFLSLQYVQLVVAILVAVLGIVNSLVVSISERRREIGILRGLGGDRAQVRTAVLLEAVCIGLVAAVLGIGSGAIMGYYSVGAFGAAFNGWVFPYRFPIEFALGLIPGVLVISLIAAWYPSLLALKTPIVEALAYE
jgi:putative ABC transport system permease protein